MIPPTWSKCRVILFASFMTLSFVGAGGGLASSATAATGRWSSPWSIEPSPNPPGVVSSSLVAVSCPENRHCLAVGNSFTSSNGEIAFAESLVGSTWTLDATPVLAGVDSSVLSGVSCATAGNCEAAGYTVSTLTHPNVLPLIEKWNGSSWTQTSVPIPANASWAILTGVSCPRPGSCVAVGGFIPRGVNAVEQPLVEQWDGSTWSVVTAPNPHAENGSDFTGIDCLAPKACEVVGDYNYADIAQSVFAYGYNGGSWTSQAQINPVGQQVNSDASVSCTSVTVCNSVGSWIGNDTLGLTEYWNGASWVRQDSHGPHGTITNELFAVSCVGLELCVAVGDASVNANNSPAQPIAEVWSGNAWLQVPTTNPVGASSSLVGVSCPPSGSCIAVGSTHGASADTTLVEVHQE